MIHYTDEAGHSAILKSQELFESTGPVHARFGDGQYLTDLTPDQIGGRTLANLSKAQKEAGQLSAGQAAKILFNDSRLTRKMTHYIEIDITDLPIRQGVLEGGDIRQGVHFFLKVYAESLDGEIGDCFIEVDSDDTIIRQVLSFDGKLYWATPDAYADERHMFTDQPEIDEKHDDLSPIPVSEFIEIWKKATSNVGEVR
ncbi:MAG: HYD1 signature containing ADP-ribosyltransferase family protein [Planctomycetaceae bacterium]